MTEAPTIASRLEELAAGLAGTRSSVGPDGATSWAVGDRPFAVLHGAAVDLRLDAAVAAAALRTPDTDPTNRGNEWIRYAPPTLEGYDLDRLEAWFGLAFRRASPPTSKT